MILIWQEQCHNAHARQGAANVVGYSEGITRTCKARLGHSAPPLDPIFEHTRMESERGVPCSSLGPGPQGLDPGCALLHRCLGTVQG